MNGSSPVRVRPAWCILVFSDPARATVTLTRAMSRCPRFAASIPARVDPPNSNMSPMPARFACEGRFSFGAGSGSYTFRENPRFVAELQQLGYDAPREDQLFNMAVMQITLDFARGIREAGLLASTDQLMELRIHGVNLSYIRETQNAGYRDLTPRDYVEMKIHGVGTDFLRALKHAGYDIPSRQVIEMRIHGIGVEYIPDLGIYALKPEPGDLIQMKIHGIDPEFIREARDLGYRFTARELIDLKIHGVGGDYLRNLKASGMRELSAEQITRLKIHGVE